MGRTIGDKVELKDKVCTLEQSKKLDNIGLKIKTEKYWYEPDSKLYTIPELEEDWTNWKIISGLCPAPDVAELMEMLPPSIEHKGVTYHLNVSKDTVYDVDYWNADLDGFLYDSEDKILSHGLADCVTWLIEQNHIKIEELNQ